MAQKLIRDIPDGTMQAIEVKAAEAGKNAEAYIRDLLIDLAASGPSVQERYAFRVYGASGSKGQIRRYSDHPNGTSETFSQFNQSEAGAMERAGNLIRRNGVGDKEAAYNLLVEQFGINNVFEVPV